MVVFDAFVKLIGRSVTKLDKWKNIIAVRPEWYHEVPKELQRSHDVAEELGNLAMKSSSDITTAIKVLNQIPMHLHTPAMMSFILDKPFDPQIDCAECYGHGCKCLRYALLTKQTRRRGDVALAHQYLDISHSLVESMTQSLTPETQSLPPPQILSGILQGVQETPQTYESAPWHLKEHPVFGMELARHLLSAPQRPEYCAICGITICWSP